MAVPPSRFQAGGDKGECKQQCGPLPRSHLGVSSTLKPLSSLWPDANRASGADSEDTTRWAPHWADARRLGGRAEFLLAQGHVQLCSQRCSTVKCTAPGLGHVCLWRSGCAIMKICPEHDTLFADTQVAVAVHCRWRL